MDEAFGNWFAGFIDGEGCFGLYKRKHSAGWIFRFFIKLRDDDAEILEALQKEVGGTIRYIPSDNPKWGGQVIWAVSSRKDCLKLVELLDEHPLRAKKRKDYQLWREAVLLFAHVTLHKSNNECTRLNAPIWAKMAAIKEELTKLRRYRPR